MNSDPYGLGRVVGQKGVLPQRAQKLDADAPLRDDELLLDVQALNVDAASFRQIEATCGGDEKKIGERIVEIVRERGKLQNPVTGSGGMLLGKVKQVGPRHPAAGSLSPGDRVATLVSLSLTPLVIDEVLSVNRKTDRVDIRGRATLFASGLWARIPDDLPEALALAAFDVCGAPALVARHARPGMNILVIGAGKSGALCLAQARRSLEGKGKLLALDISAPALQTLQDLRLCDEGFAADATAAIDILERVTKATNGALCDLVINCASVAGTEMASILSVKAGGTVVFFSMATSFSAAALGAEGVGKDVSMLIGNGFVPGHADLTLDLLRTEPELRALFENKFVPAT